MKPVKLSGRWALAHNSQRRGWISRLVVARAGEWRRCRRGSGTDTGWLPWPWVSRAARCNHLYAPTTRADTRTWTCPTPSRVYSCQQLISLSPRHGYACTTAATGRVGSGR